MKKSYLCQPKLLLVNDGMLFQKNRAKSSKVNASQLNGWLLKIVSIYVKKIQEETMVEEFKIVSEN